jgi:DNA-directed RNA polymerase specialized sigma subunit
MMGAAHITFLSHCVRAKMARDLRAKGPHAEQALRRIAIARDCEKILSMLSRCRTPEPHEVAAQLGWRPPLVLLDAGLNDAAREWLDARFRV